MVKKLQEGLNGNFDERNLENIDKLIEEPKPAMFGLFVNEAGNGKEVKITEASRKICAKSLLR